MKIVFISHAASDPEWPDTEVAALAREIQAAGATVLLDEWKKESLGRKLSPQEWREWMREGLEKSTHVLCLISQSYAEACDKSRENLRGRGVALESSVIDQTLYDKKQDNQGWAWIVLPNDAAAGIVPRFLKSSCPQYRLPSGRAQLVRDAALDLTSTKPPQDTSKETCPVPNNVFQKSIGDSHAMKSASTDSADFYSSFIAELEQTPRPNVYVDFYTISACFGFYSLGMKRFSDMLKAMRDAVRQPHDFEVTIRLLVKVDSNPIDGFAIDRFKTVILTPLRARKASSIGATSSTGRETDVRIISNPKEYCQFAIFGDAKNGDTKFIRTDIQRFDNDDLLNIGINHLSPMETVTDIPASRSHLRRLFDTSWAEALKIE